MELCEEFWQSVPDRVAHAKALWRDGYTSTRARVAFEDLLFELKRDATELALVDVRDLVVALEVFAISVPLSASASRIAEPGVAATLDMLAALAFPNVAVHFTALFRLLIDLTNQVTADEGRAGEFRPVFVSTRRDRSNPRRPGGPGASRWW